MKQMVAVNGAKSNQISAKLGVPRGSVLGPIFFSEKPHERTVRQERSVSGIIRGRKRTRKRSRACRSVFSALWQFGE